MFKVGHKVKCVQPNSSLKLDAIYTISEVRPTEVIADLRFPEADRKTYMILVKEMPETEFFAVRFELVLICICTANQLLWGGCTCGVWEKEKSIKEHSS